MIGLTSLGWFPLGFYETGQLSATAVFEIMDCPDNWDDQLETFSGTVLIGALIPGTVTGKAKTWIG